MADAPHRAHHVLDNVGAGERAPQLLRQSKLRDGEDLVDAFQDRAGDPGPVSFETLGKVLERRATTKNNENQSVCDRFSIVYLLYTGTSYPDWVSS